MNSIAGFPYFEIQFNKAGEACVASEVEALLAYLQQNPVSDLFVMSHGWLTDMQGARSLYTRFFEQVRSVLDGNKVASLGTRSYVVLGVLWPSKKFTDPNQIAGGAAGLAASTEEAVEEQLAGLEEWLGEEEGAAEKMAALRALIPQLEDDETARAQFADGVRALLTQGAAEEEDGSEALFDLGSDDLMQKLSEPILVAPEPSGEGGAAELGDFSDAVGGGAAGLISLGGFTGAAENLLNYATYYEMKARAGLVGSKGLNPLLAKIHTLQPSLKLHLVGHSFGGRLVAATALGTAQPNSLQFQTLCLLQTAFSHFGFAQKLDGKKDGFFRKVVENHVIIGATLITHTKNDKAVGVAYPIASALAKDNAAGLGDADDSYGAIGSNGALKTPEAIPGLLLQAVGHPYKFQAGKLHNLLADSYIKDHGDICKPEVAYALLTAVAMS